MSFFNSVKRLFGFGYDDFDEEFGEDATVIPRKGTASEDTPVIKPNVEIPQEEVTAKNDVQIPFDAIFDHVIEVFNKSLPTFLSSSVDPAAQRKYLYDTLDESVKDYVSQLSKQIAEDTRKNWKTDRDKILQQVSELQEKEKKSEDRISEVKNLQLSAERQKRAFAEKVHDLENQISKLEADREQLQLENRSLINKIKVCSVQENDIEALNAEIANLKVQLEQANAQTIPDESNESYADEISALKHRVEEIESENSVLKTELLAVKNENKEIKENSKRVSDEKSTLQAKNEELREARDLIGDERNVLQVENAKLKSDNETVIAENNSLKEDISSLTLKIQQYETKTGMADQMVTDFNQIAANAKKELEFKKKECLELQERINGFIIDSKSQSDHLEKAESTIADLESKLSLSNEQLQATQNELAEAHENLSVLDEIQQMVEQFESVKEKKDAKIAELSSQKGSLEQEITSLKKTIEQNLIAHAQSEAELRQEIAELKSKPQVEVLHEDVIKDEDVIVSDTFHSEDSDMPKISAIDETLDNTDWLSPCPTEEELKKSEAAGADKPQLLNTTTTKRVVHNDEGQLSIDW